MNIERPWQQRTNEEIDEEERVRAELRKRYPGTVARVSIRICCPAQSDTGMSCDLPPGHEGKHWVICKDRQW